MQTKPTSACAHSFCTQICYYCDFPRFYQNQPVESYLEHLIEGMILTISKAPYPLYRWWDSDGSICASISLLLEKLTEKLIYLI